MTRILPWVLWTPLAGALAAAFVPRRWPAFFRWWALAVSMATFGASLAMLARFHTGEPGMQFVVDLPWIREFGARYALGVDGISLFLVLLTAFLTPVCVLASWNIERNPKLFMGLLLALETALVGAFVATDLLLFFLFWDFVLVPMYFLIGYWGYERRIYAAVKFFLYTFLGSVLMFAAIVFLAFAARVQLGHFSFSFADLQQLSLSLGTQRWLFLAFFAAFAIKVPLFPVHTWLPDAHTEAPTAGSVILAAILLKMGAYGLIRFAAGLFPQTAREWAPWIAALAIVGILYGAVVSMMQRDLKRLVAYSSVSHLGFVVLGIFAFTVTSAQGATLQMINHGLSTGALFLIVGMLYERRHTREIADYGGVAATAPVLAGLFLFVALSSLGLPGLNGFVGEFLVLVGTFTVHRTWAVLAALGVILSALYLLWAYQRTMHGPVTIEQNRLLSDASAREKLLLAPVVGLILLIGVWPKPFLDRMEPSVRAVIERVERAQAGSTFTSLGGP